MKTLDEIKEEYAISLSTEYENLNWQSLLSGNGVRNMEHHHDAVAKRYAKEVAIQALKNASENAKTIKNGNSGSWFDAGIDKQSILNEKNITEI